MEIVEVISEHHDEAGRPYLLVREADGTEQVCDPEDVPRSAMRQYHEQQVLAALDRINRTRPRSGNWVGRRVLTSHGRVEAGRAIDRLVRRGVLESWRPFGASARFIEIRRAVTR